MHLDAAEKLCPEGSPLKAELLHIAGNLKQRQGLYTDALGSMEKALKLKKQHPNHFNEASVAYSQHGLANLHSVMKMPLSAEEAYQQAICKKRHFYGNADQLDVARSETRYAQSLGSTKEELVKAMHLLHHALSVYKSFLSEEQFEIACAKKIHSSKAAKMHKLPATPLVEPSIYRCLLGLFIHPWHVGAPKTRYYATMDDAPPGTREFMKTFAPQESFQHEWLSKFGPTFSDHAHQFLSDGILILPAYLCSKDACSILNAVCCWLSPAELHQKFTSTIPASKLLYHSSTIFGTYLNFCRFCTPNNRRHRFL